MPISKTLKFILTGVGISTLIGLGYTYLPHKKERYPEYITASKNAGVKELTTQANAIPKTSPLNGIYAAGLENHLWLKPAEAGVQALTILSLDESFLTTVFYGADGKPVKQEKLTRNSYDQFVAKACNTYDDFTPVQERDERAMLQDAETLVALNVRDQLIGKDGCNLDSIVQTREGSAQVLRFETDNRRYDISHDLETVTFSVYQKDGENLSVLETTTFPRNTSIWFVHFPTPCETMRNVTQEALDSHRPYNGPDNESVPPANVSAAHAQPLSADALKAGQDQVKLAEESLRTKPAPTPETPPPEPK